MRLPRLILSGLVVLGLITVAGCAWRRAPGPILERDAFSALRELADAYETRDRAAFRARVSEYYAGDSMVLERSVGEAFSRYARIQMNISPAGAAVSSDRRRVSLTVQFVRQVTPVSTGVPVTDEGMTMVTMVRERDGWKLERQGAPALFGL